MELREAERDRPVAVRIPARDAVLAGEYAAPPAPRGVVVFAHGSGSGRHSPRNQRVAAYLREHHHATLLLDLLTPAEEQVDAVTAHLRFDVRLLAERVIAARDWLVHQGNALPLGYFGASTGAAAALIAAARRPQGVRAIVSRGGRPDLAGDALPLVHAPTLLLVGGRDEVVLGLNEEAQARMTALTVLDVIPGATHLFEEKGALDEVARRAAAWFDQHLG